MSKTIYDAVQATKQHLSERDPGQPDRPSHWETLIGERPAGSKWGREFTEADFSMEWVEATEKVDPELRGPGCRYFTVSPNELMRAFPDRTVGAIPLNQLEAAELHNVRLRNGAHGVELVYEGELDPEGSADEAWVILGPHKTDDGEEHLVVFTAHPGPLMKHLPADSFKDFFEKPYAVKLL